LNIQHDSLKNNTEYSMLRTLANICNIKKMIDVMRKDGSDFSSLEKSRSESRNLLLRQIKSYKNLLNAEKRKNSAEKLIKDSEELCDEIVSKSLDNAYSITENKED